MRLQGRLATLAWILVVGLPWLARGIAAEPYRTDSTAAVRESFKFDPADRLVLIPVRVGSKDYSFVLDTGTTWSVFDASLRSQLGPRVDSVRMKTADGTELDLESYAAPDARIGSLPLTRDPVVCRDLTAIRETSGCPVHGIIGMDFLRVWIVTIDFDEGRIAVLPPATERDPTWGQCVPFVYNATGSPLVLVTVGKDVRVPFLLDTGNAGTGDLEEAVLTRLLDSHEARVTGKGAAMTLSGIRSSRVGRLSHVSLGSFQHENLRFIGGKQNILGSIYLARYRATIDFAGERLYLAKGKLFASHDDGHKSGLALLFKASGVVADSVDKNGPAYAAGVRSQDVIVTLSGKAVSQWKPSEVNRLLMAEDKAVRMTVRRGDKRIEINFTPKEYD